MERRFQVFVSSTFTDLVEARHHVVQTLLQLDCIPAGMELFPATDNEQWKFITKVIDDCDYYLLIIGGRYGSTTSEGISYTEREFDYAVKQGIPILAFVHGDPDLIPVGKSDIAPDARQKLATFREKACRDRLVKAWKEISDLPGLVALSLTKAFKTHPSHGWIRGTGTDRKELLEQINELRQRNDELEAKLRKKAERQPFETGQLAPTDSKFKISGTYKIQYNGHENKWETACTWNDILYHIGPDLFQWTNENTVNSSLAKAILEKTEKKTWSAKIDDESFKTLKIQMIALGWADVRPLNTKSGTVSLFWTITSEGKQALMRLRTIKK